MKNAYDIMPVGKRRNVFIVTQQKPRRRKLRGFFPFWRGGLVPRLTTSCLFSIQPFANVVGDYTCQNRKHKRRNYIHNNAPPFRTCIRGGSLAIVSCLGLFVYKKNKMLKYWFFSHLTAWDHIRVSVADLIFFVNCTSCFKFCSAQPTL